MESVDNEKEPVAVETEAGAAEIKEEKEKKEVSEPREGEREPREGEREPREKEFRDNRDNRPRGGSFRGRRGMFRKKVCKFCTQGLKVDYKKPDTLRRFITERGKILPRRITGTCAKHQRVLSQEIKRARVIAVLSQEIKRARVIALLPYTKK
jgi:small subunit ribosomal protein S18